MLFSSLGEAMQHDYNSVANVVKNAASSLKPPATPRIDRQELPSVVVRKVQKLIVLYKQSKKNPKITGWGQGWYLADSKTTVLARSIETRW